MKIAIAAYGIEGQASYRYYSKDPLNDITIFDENPQFVAPDGVASVVGPHAFESMQDFDLVLRSPPVAPRKIHTNGKVWSGTNEFFARSPATVIGVTGTKGKGTTSSMIASILEAAGKKVWLVGNIGTAALDVLPQVSADDIVIYELSSFQLWDLQKSPHIAVVLPVEAEHLDVHANMEDYVSAKRNIRLHQTADDICIYHPNNEYARLIALSVTAPMERYLVAADGGAYVKDGAFYAGEHIICSVEVMQVPGVHNVENACAAISVALQFGLSNDVIAQGLSSFKGLPHRIEFVREFDGVDYYNDSFSSGPAATIAAIHSLPKPKLVIIGGVDRGADATELADTIKAQPDVKEVVLIGQTRHKIQALFAEHAPETKVTIFDGTTMDDIIGYARENTASGDVVLLSPGFASFDMFKDFYDRGDQFREKVNAL